MCEADAYLIKDGIKRVIMESVDIMRPEGEDIYLENSTFGINPKQ